MKISIIAAHPDDEVLGCGGTIARLAGEGHEVSVTILGEGISSRYDQRGDADHEEIEKLHRCSREVAKVLGVRDISIDNFPDNRFDTVPLLDIVKTIEGSLEKSKPDCVFTHHNSDLNMDHVIVHRATLIATRPTQDTPVKTVLSYEVPSSTEWSFQKTEKTFHPSVFIDIGVTLDTKIRAMESYDGERREFPHPRSPEALRAIAFRWGSVAGLGAAEAFELIRHIR